MLAQLEYDGAVFEVTDLERWFEKHVSKCLMSCQWENLSPNLSKYKKHHLKTENKNEIKLNRQGPGARLFWNSLVCQVGKKGMVSS